MQRWALAVVLAAAVAAALWMVLGVESPNGTPLQDDETQAREDDDGGGPGLRLRERKADPARRELAPDEVLTGLVIDDSRRPLAGVPVELRAFPPPHAFDEDSFFGHWHGALVARTRTNARGRFGFPRHGLRKFVVHAYPDSPWRSVAEVVWYPGYDDIWLMTSRGHALQGRVLGLDGRPARARISAVFYDSPHDQQTPEWVLSEQSTSAEGVFSIPSAPKGVLLFDVTLPDGTQRRGVPVLVPAPGDVVLDLSLTSPAEVVGTVRDGTGMPVAGATLAIEVRDREGSWLGWSRASTSDSEGAYRLAPLGVGWIQRVRVTCDGYVPVARGLHGVTLRAGHTQRFDPILAAGATLVGRVVDRGGKPLPEARIDVWTNDDDYSLQHRVAFTDAEGAYRLDGLPSVWLKVHATAHGHYVDVTRTPSGHKRILLIQPAGAKMERNYVMAPGSPVSGTVRDGSGRPVAGLFVYAQVHREEDTQLSERTNDDGAFALPGLDPSLSWEISVQTDGWRTPEPSILRLNPETPAILDLVVRRPPQVKGVVLGADGQPVAGICVMAKTHWTMTDTQGRFTLIDMPVGQSEISLRRGVQPVTVQLAWGEVKHGLIVRTPRLLSIAGVVLDPSGKPVPDLFLDIDAVPDGTRTDVAGAFRFDGVPPGTHNVELDGAREQPVQAGDENVRLRWEPIKTTRRLEGSIVDSEGRPVPRASVTMWLEHEDDMSGEETEAHGGWFAVSDDEGEFEGKQVHIMVEQPRDAAGVALDLQPTMVRDVDPSQPVVVRMESGATLRGRVVDEAGQPVANCRLSAKSEEIDDWYFDNDEFESITLSDGTFRFTGVPTGKVVLRIHPPAIFEGVPPRDVHTDAETIAITLRRGGRLAGTVLLPSGEPAAWARIRGRWRGEEHGWRSRETTTDATGRFTLEGVGIAPVKITVKQPQNWHRRAWPYLVPNVTFTPGEGDAHITLVRGGFIECTAWRESVRVSHGRVVVYHKDSLSEVAREALDPDDPTLLGPLPLGSYILIVYGWRKQPGESEPIEITAPAEDVRVSLERGLSLHGQVDEWHGLAAHMRFVRPKPLEKLKFTVNADGSFEVHAPTNAPGTLVMAASEGRIVYETNVRPSESPHRFVLREGGTIRGRLAVPPDEGGEVRVSARAIGMTHKVETKARRDGTFELKGLFPLRYNLYRVRNGASTRVARGVHPGEDDVVIERR